MSTLGTPAISPPTRGIMATSATHSPMRRAKGTPRMSRVTRTTTPNSTDRATVPST